MLRDTFSEMARLVIGILFTIAVIALCKFWPERRKGKRRD